MSYEAEKEAAIEAALRVSGVIQANAGRLSREEVHEKGRNDLVTEIDVAVQKSLVEFLGSAFPDDGFVAEEDTPGLSAARNRRWIIDPVDGTTNFVHGLSPYSVSIALEDASQIVVAIVLEVSRDELFVAVRGQGLTVNGRAARVSTCDSPRCALVATGFPTRPNTAPFMQPYMQVLKQVMETCQSVRRIGSAAADLAFLAAGRLDGFFEIGLGPWDAAAGSLLISEGGGMVTDFSGGGDFVFGSQMLATNGKFHARMLEIVSPLRDALDNEDSRGDEHF
jgi:myo-inositol-1(or 4)-monophosphatase